MSLYTPPEFMGYYPEADLASPWYRAPLPFRNLSLLFSRAALGLDGSDLGYDQLTHLGVSLYPTSNICGSLAYRYQHTKLITPDGASYSDIYGIEVFSGTTPSGKTEIWEKEYDYTFVDERDADYIDPVTGVHEERWKPVVGTALVVDSGPETVRPTYYFGISAERGTFPYYRAHPDHPPSREFGGSVDLSLPITREWLDDKTEIWAALPSTARRRTTRAGYYGQIAAVSETTAGRSCFTTTGMWWMNLDITGDVGVPEDYFYERGWPGSVRVNVPTTLRKNAPVIYDTVNTYPGTLYNQQVSQAELTQEITSNRWLDQFGIYDPAGSGAFTGMGWRTLGVETDLNGSLVAVRPESAGGKSGGRLLSATGLSYRATLDVMGYADDLATEISVVKTVVVSVTSATPGDYDLRMPSNFLGSTSLVVVSKLERLDDTGYVEIPATNAVSTVPSEGVALLSIGRWREGLRWGFPQFYEGGWPEDVGDIYQSSSMRFFKRQSYRSVGRATTAP